MRDFFFGLTFSVLTACTVTLKVCLDRVLDLDLVGLRIDLEGVLVCSPSERVFFR